MNFPLRVFLRASNVPRSRSLSSIFVSSWRITPQPTRRSIFFFQRATMAAVADPQQALRTSGDNDPVWVHQEPYSERPSFPKLDKNLSTDVCIIGSGITGISTAYELVTQGVKVVMLEGRDVISGESGRTSGHLASSLDAGYGELEGKHGKDGVKNAIESHGWALNRVGEISKQLSIECEYRKLPDYEISQYEKGTPGHNEEMKIIQEDVEKAQEYGFPASYQEGYAIMGWDGKVDQRDVAIYKDQATFHPTQYLVGLLKWLAKQENFSCYTHTRMISCEEKGLLKKEVHVSTLDGYTITCKDAVEATCIPLQKLAVVAQLEYYRTYCIAIRIPKGSVEDCLINDQADPYIYVRFTACDNQDDYLVVGGLDHKVGQEAETANRFSTLEKWVRDRFTKAGTVDYKWSGQILNSSDMISFIGLNQGKSHTYICTGDTGHGLTQGVLAGKLIADQILGVENPGRNCTTPSVSLRHQQFLVP